MGDKFESTKSAIDYMRATYPDNTEAVRKLSTKFSRVTGLKEVKKPPVKVEEDSVQFARTVISKVTSQVEEANKDPVWVEDETLPAGWRMRRGKGDAEVFLNPEGKQVGSRHSVLELLRREGAPEEEVARVRGGLTSQGWAQDPRLPEGFLRREILGKVNTK